MLLQYIIIISVAYNCLKMTIITLFAIISETISLSNKNTYHDKLSAGHSLLDPSEQKGNIARGLSVVWKPHKEDRKSVPLLCFIHFSTVNFKFLLSPSSLRTENNIDFLKSHKRLSLEDSGAAAPPKWTFKTTCCLPTILPTEWMNSTEKETEWDGEP